MSKTTTKTTRKASTNENKVNVINSHTFENDDTCDNNEIKRSDECDDLNNLVEKVKEPQQKSKITPQNYIFHFGRYRGLFAKDVKNLKKLNKFNKMEPVGLKYIMWCLTQTWLNEFDRDILTKVLELE